MKHCFGFGDSGTVSLATPTGIISILGRNSSGKSSLLSAISSLSPESAAPDTNDRFENFYDPSKDDPLLWSDVELQAPPTEADIDSALREYLRAKGAPRDFLNADQALTETLSACIEQFQPLFHRVASNHTICVYRRGSGYIGLTTHGESVDDQTQRRNAIGKLLTGTFQPDGSLKRGSTIYPLEMHVSRFLYELARLVMPQIFLFGNRFQLQANLPDRITGESLPEADGLERYLLELLSVDSLKEFFTINDPDRRAELLTDFNKRLSDLAHLVNKGANTPMLEFVLHEKNGLQLTTKVDGKKSFYRHLSDNTKFLVGYNLATHGGRLPPSVLLFDEPNTGFHPSAQRQLLDFLERLASEHQVILTTHSEHLLDIRHLRGIRMMTTDSNGLLRVENNPLSRRLAGRDALALQPIMDAIGHVHGGPFLLSKGPRAILVEGITDLMHLRAVSTLLKLPIEPMLIPGRGESTLPTITALCIAQGVELRFVLDTGLAAGVLKRDYLVPDEAILEIPPWGSSKASGIEDLYTKDDFAELLQRAGLPVLKSKFEKVPNSVYVKGTAKTLVAHQAMNDHLEFLDTQTRNAFIRVLAFISAEGAWFSA